MAPNSASNPHISGPKGGMGAYMGFTGSAFSVRSNLVGRVFHPEQHPRPGKSTFSAFLAHFRPENGQVFSVRTVRTARKIKFSACFSIFLGHFFALKTAKYLQSAWPLYGAPRAENEKNRSVFDENIYFLKPQQKIKFAACFSIFFRSDFFVGWGPEFL